MNVHYLLLTLFSLFFFLGDIGATHNRAGEITYRQIGPLTVEITITTYTKFSPPSNQADREELDVDWGDGSGMETVKRTQAIDGLYSDIRVNTYIATHTYPGPTPFGNPYVVSMQDLNRNADILNVNNGQSVSIPFYVETEIYLFSTSTFGLNSSPILLEPPVDFGIVGEVFQHTPNGYDPDGDSVAYELVTPLMDKNTPVPGYQLVTDFGGSATAPNQYTFDEKTGLFTWDSPRKVGEYNIAILVKSYRNGRYLGAILRDIQIDIRQGNNTPPELEVQDICIQAGELIDFDVIARDNDLPAQNITLTATGGPLDASFIQPASFNGGLSNPVIGTSPIQGRFLWQTDCRHVRGQDYQLVFKAKDDYVNGNGQDAGLATFKTMQITIVAPAPQNLTAELVNGQMELEWDAPYACANWDGFFGFSVWRKEGCDAFVPDSCQTGLEGSGYTQVNVQLVKTPVGNKYVYVDNTIQAGVSYSYRVMGEFGTPVYNGSQIVNFQDPVSSVASEEACVEISKDLPLMVNVDIEETDVANGEILVRWTKPNAFELDTNQNIGPYYYELYHSEDLNGGAFGATPVYTSPQYNSFALANDTTFKHLGIDTENKPHSYRVAFYSNGNQLGTTANASSVRLTVASSDEQNTLSWTENVPWTNVEYVVYLEQPKNSGIFTILDTVVTASYLHQGLTNAEEYCYYVMSIGGYFIPSLPDTLYNRSQIACGTPLDTIAPCPPNAVLSFSGCSIFQDDANKEGRKPCEGYIEAQTSFFNEIKWQYEQDSCSQDVASFKVYYSPYCTGDYELVYESTGLNDTSFQHVPSNRSLAGCYYVTSIDSVEVNGGGNEGEGSTVVVTDNCPFYDLPNVFSPNGDGQNDLFTPCLEYRFISKVEFQVTNRWGEVVFETEDPAINWDGTNQKTGKALAEGVYYYTCNVFQDCMSCEAVQPMKGFIHIVRGNN